MTPEEEILAHLKDQSLRIQHIEQTLTSIKRFFIWTLVITLVVTILPLIGLIFALPSFISSLGI